MPADVKPDVTVVHVQRSKASAGQGRWAGWRSIDLRRMSFYTPELGCCTSEVLQCGTEEREGKREGAKPPHVGVGVRDPSTTSKGGWGKGKGAEPPTLTAPRIGGGGVGVGAKLHPPTPCVGWLTE